MKQTRIGVLQFIPHLDDAVWGFMKTVEAGVREKTHFEILEAEGMEDRCLPLARELVRKGCRLLFGCLTPAAAALKVCADQERIPVVFAPVFHPELSGLVEKEQYPGGHVTGVTGRLSSDEKVEKILTVFSGLEEAVILANGRDRLSCWEAHSLAHSLQARDVSCAIQEDSSGHPKPSKAGRVHILAFSPELEETMEEWIEPFFDEEAPIIGSSARAGFLGAVMAVFADHGICGEIAGEMAAEILKGKPPGEMAVRHPPGACIGFNHFAAGRLGITIPPSLSQKADIL